jgi:hypothetical protein
MPRSADYTIEGFLYQFHKTILEILQASDDAEVTVEGPIEDIEVSTPSDTTVIQCKYHETNDQFTSSSLYKPLLQMMDHFHRESSGQVRYRLFAHFPDQKGGTTPGVKREDLEEALASKNKDLKKYTEALKDNVDVDAFLDVFSFQLGPSFEDMVSDVMAALRASEIPDDDIDVLAYPNAIDMVQRLSIKHDPVERVISRQVLLGHLHSIKKTAITRWTLTLKSRKQMLDARRKQLRPNLSKNSRLRYFLIDGEAVEDFDSRIVLFIKAYLEKYHFKYKTHYKPPLFCINKPTGALHLVQIRLYHKGVTCNDGCVVAGQFDVSHFYRSPMMEKSNDGQVRREFHLRILPWEGSLPVLNQHRPDDLFVFGDLSHSDLDLVDVEVEAMTGCSLKEISYMIGVSDVYE